ncbi:hypothetical protein BMS3Bbin01_02659 [bacterium BMS3Bbin01]|nr:hypothetical protein BMS3Bbin01_02659 [bacterium BMS3Bbin01]
MKEIIDLMGQGTIGGKSFTIDLANGGEVISYNPGYALPTDVKQLAEDTVKGISDGSINPPRP